MKYFVIVLLALSSFNTCAQLFVQENAGLYIQKGSSLFVEGNLESYSDFSGDGTLLLSGSIPQSLNLHGSSLGHLSINNPKDVSLGGDLLIKGSLQLINGKLICGNHLLTLGENADIRTMKDQFIVTNGEGIVRKMIEYDLSDYVIPLGTSSGYTPLKLTTSGSYTNGHIDIGAKGTSNPHKPGNAEHYLQTYWAITKSGISGSVSTTVKYPPSSVHGKETELSGFYWNGSTWSPSNSILNTANRQITFDVHGDKTELFAMDPISLHRKISLSPDPVHTSTTLRLYAQKFQTGSLKVVDANGRVILSKSISIAPGRNQYYLHVGGFRNGYYSVVVSAVGIDESIKLIKL